MQLGNKGIRLDYHLCTRLIFVPNQEKPRVTTCDYHVRRRIYRSSLACLHKPSNMGLEDQLLEAG